MDYLVIEGVKPWDGRYEFDLGDSELTTREWGWIKRYCRLHAADGRGGLPAATRSCSPASPRSRSAGPARSTRDDVADVFDRFARRPRSVHDPLESDSAAEEDDADPPPPSSSGNTTSSGDDSTDEFGDTRRPPERLWDARLGYFGVSPGEVGELTPAQLLGCVDMFAAMHEGGDD